MDCPWDEPRNHHQGREDQLHHQAGDHATVHGDAGRVTVAVLTYRRPQFWPDLLTDLDREAQLTATAAAAVRVLVVDNDPEGSARSVVGAVAVAVPVTYVVEPRRGIAAARNRALQECEDDDVLVFVDDDERPDPGWLAALLSTYLTSRPAAVAGPVRTRYLGTPHPWALAGGFVDRSHRDGVRTGEAVTEAATNNLLLDLRWVRQRGLYFDESLGLGGGEDSLFTRQLTGGGGRILWCAEAWVTDLRPGDRTTRRALLRRAYSFANAGVAVQLRLASGRGGSTSRARLTAAAGGLARLVLGLVLLVGGALARRPDGRARAARLLARGAGGVAGALGLRHQEYGGSVRPPTA